MPLTNRIQRWIAATVALIALAGLASACGSEGASDTGDHGNGGVVAISGLKQTGPGLTEPTRGSGARISGGTVTFAESAGSPPNYIFPMYSSEYCINSNLGDLTTMLYRPLYWEGNNYSPTIDFSDSVGQKPAFSNHGKTVTIRLNRFKWSDGEAVSARDLVFWMNLLKADPAVWCDYSPGKFPDNVTSYRAVNPSTFQLTFNRAYNPNWILYSELTQLTPMPMAWDRTSLSQKAPNADAANLPDTTKRGALAVYKFLNAQGQQIGSWGSSPLWRVVDGPWRVASTTSNGGVTFVPNKSYSGPVKASISKFVEVPFTSEASLIDQIKSTGPAGLTVGYIPSQYQPLTASLASQGYDVNMASLYSYNSFPLNLNNPTVGPIFRQLYFRQALQHLVDQPGWIKSFLHGAAVATYGPVPPAPPNKLLAGVSSTTNPYPFSVSDAKTLLGEHGWRVVAGGQSVCEKPGTGSGDCGAGIARGKALAFTLDYVSGMTSMQEEMQDLQSQAGKVGMKITLTNHPFNTLIATMTQCTPREPKCAWEAANPGASWIYTLGSGYPSGEEDFMGSATANPSNYSNPKMDALIMRTLTSSASDTVSSMRNYSEFAEKDLPVVWQPTPIGTLGFSAGMLISNKLGGYAANAVGLLTPENWYLTK